MAELNLHEWSFCLYLIENKELYEILFSLSVYADCPERKGEKRRGKGKKKEGKKIVLAIILASSPYSGMHILSST